MILHLLRLLFGSHIAGIVTHHRYFHRYDAARNMTVLVCYGPLDSHALEGAKEVLRGKAHARHYATKKAPLFEGKEAAA